MTPTDQSARWAELHRSKAKRTPILLQLRPRVDASRSNLRLVLDGLARELWQKASLGRWISVAHGLSVPEPVGRAKGGFGLGTRTERKDRRCLIVAEQVRPALGSSGHDLEGVSQAVWLPALFSPKARLDGG